VLGMSLLAVFISVLLNTSASLLLKIGATRLGALSYTNGILDSIVRMAFQPYILGGIACYATSLVVWVFVLSKESVGVAYPCTALVYVLNAIAAYYFLGEVMRPSQWIGLFLILAGVVLVINPK
jgi:drug/metabolite transporter (DMT)-like permease